MSSYYNYCATYDLCVFCDIVQVNDIVVLNDKNNFPASAAAAAAWARRGSVDIISTQQLDCQRPILNG